MNQSLRKSNDNAQCLFSLLSLLIWFKHLSFCQYTQRGLAASKAYISLLLWSLLTDNQEDGQEKWCWLVDMERTCATLIGQCLGGMLVGDQMSKQEKSCLPWLENPVFGNGAEMSSNHTGNYFICIAWILNSYWIDIFIIFLFFIKMLKRKISM